MAVHISLGAVQAHEQRALDTITELLAPEWLILSNVPSRLAGREIDVLLMGPRGLLVASLKDHRGDLTITVKGPWLRDGVAITKKSGKPEHNFVDDAQQQAQILKESWAAYDPNTGAAWIDRCVVVTNPRSTLTAERDVFFADACMIDQLPLLIERRLALGVTKGAAGLKAVTFAELESLLAFLGVNAGNAGPQFAEWRANAEARARKPGGQRADSGSRSRTIAPPPPPPHDPAAEERRRAVENQKRKEREDAERKRQEKEAQQWEEAAQRRRAEVFWGWVRGLIVLAVIVILARAVLGWMNDQPVPGPTIQTYYVAPPPGEPWIPVHYNPGGSVAGHIQRGQAVRVNFVTSQSGRRWAHIINFGSVGGYVSADHLTLEVPRAESAPPPPPSRADFERMVVRGLDQSAARNAPGFNRVAGAPDHFVTLSDEGRADWHVQLRGGVFYRVVGTCGDGCSDLDLEVYDPRGRRLDSHAASDKWPELAFTASDDGDYRVRIIAFNCNAAGCLAGARLLSDPATAPVPPATGTGAESDQPRTTHIAPPRESADSRICRRTDGGDVVCRSSTGLWEIQSRGSNGRPAPPSSDWSGPRAGEPVNGTSGCILPNGEIASLSPRECRSRGGSLNR